MNLDFSHLPAWVEASASGIWRATANIIEIACSAVVIELPKGVFITITPFFEAAGMSTLSTPMPARPMTLRLVARSSTLVGDLGGGADGEAIILADDLEQLSLSLPTSGRKSTSTPRSRKICTAVSERLVGDENFGGHVSWSLLGMGRGTCGVGAPPYGAPEAWCSAPIVPRSRPQNAQSSQGIRASTSEVSTVPPHQIRRPAGASR